MQLIEEARQAWRFASVRLAVLAGVVSGWAATDPHGFAKLMDSLPEEVRPLVGVLVAGSAIYTRLIKQGDKSV
ncbi:MAG: hypothetical protein B7Y36_18955 [Novosphingobium sp. 28-62-57]|uniref:DUF7940 domain-containing protein n=1 Tax=unclassified Novosphingobium TaxID=2644732 RepID=UPI000BD9A65A|nr:MULTISPECIES: hypothetical protein [unclassified Novosphingobium]OYZ07726.1 MAG: hypothetical protein B7Y36_18955 [Novosphingobium sp. 28-62-57]HQS71623.1 hypothetical protein [Novosphingobium sp.]